MSKKILLVEDNELNRDMLIRRLNRAGLEVVAAGDGQQALELMRSELPDVVLMESILHGMTAGEVVEYLRVSGIYRETPILLLAGRTEENAGRQLPSHRKARPI